VNTGSVEGSVLADESTLDGVAVGDGNTVVSDSTNVATGDGSSVSDDDVDVDIVSAGDVAVTDTNFGQGNTVDDSITNEYNDSFNTTNTDSFNTDASTTNTDSFNTDASTNDSFNTDASTTDSFNTDASIDYDDSFNSQSQDIGDEQSAASEPADDPMDI
jgi:hypothetical protein